MDVEMRGCREENTLPEQQSLKYGTKQLHQDGTSHSALNESSRPFQMYVMLQL